MSNEFSFWKLSHGTKYFSEAYHNECIQRNIVLVHPDTKAKGQNYTSQGEYFTDINRKYDVFYLSRGNSEISLIGIFTEDLSEETSDRDKKEWHERKFIILKESINRNQGYTGKESKWWLPSDNSTFTEVKESDCKFFEKEILKPFFKLSIDELLILRQKSIINYEQGVQMKELIELITANKNMILTGAPGTGKTYLAKQIAEVIVKESLNTQKTPLVVLQNSINNFQPDLKAREEKENLLKMFLTQFPKDKITSLSLDEYCAGKGDRNNFCWWIETGLKILGKYTPGSARSYLIYWSKERDEYSRHGYIKDEADNKKALKTLLTDIYGLVEDKNSQAYEDKFGNGLILKILNTYYPDEFFPINSTKHIDNVIRLFNLKTTGNILSDKNKVINDFYKTQCKNKGITPFEFMRILYDTFNIAEGEIIHEDKIVSGGDISFVQFHPSYDYTDFVEGLRPVKKLDNNDIGFELKNGIFKDFCRKAKNNPNKSFVFIIDEINRGEISKIFGELFFSIDPGYRGEKGKVKTQYANMQTEETFYSDFDEDYFYVPENVYIIGTMNDIDRSVESFDFAMRRRFVWKEIKAENTQNMLDTLPAEIDVDLAKIKMKNLNSVIGEMDELSSHYHIGAAYFLKLADHDGDFVKLWELHLEPLLREYLRGMPDAEKKLNELKSAYETDN